MPFPDTERVEFENNPLNEVVCQLTFPPILRIASAEPADFQDRIREAYPEYDKEEQSGFESDEARELLENLGLSAPSGERVIHRFISENQTRSIALSKELVAVTNNDYQRWTDFRPEIVRVMEAVEEVYEPGHYKQISLRYQDVIDRIDLEVEEADWAELLNPALSGLLSDPEVRGNVESTRTLASVGLEEPAGAEVRIQHGFATRTDTEPNRRIYVIDSDFVLENQNGNEDVPEILDRFNEVAGDLFRWAISDRLREALGPLEGD